MELNRYFKITIHDVLVDKPLVTQSDQKIATQSNDLIYITGYMKANDGFGISEGSMNLEEILCDSKFSLGEICSNKFEVELYGLTVDVSGKDITVTCIENDNEIPIFEGTIESSVKDNYSDSRTITAYDKLYWLRDVNVAEWWENIWKDKTTIKIGELRKSLTTYMGLEESEIVSTFNQNLEVPKYNEFTSITFEDVLRMICEVQACIPHMTRDGKLTFLLFDYSPNDITDLYEKNSSTFEDYTTQTITGINIYNSSDEFVYNYGTTDNAYVITNNIFLMSLSQADLEIACKNIYGAISNIQYRPCDVKMIVSDLSLEVGSMIVTNMGTHYITAQTFSGQLLVEQEIKCEAESESLDQSATDRNNDIIEGKKWSSIKQTVDQISTTVSDVNTALSGEIQDVRSQITQTAEKVTTKITTDIGKDLNPLVTSLTVAQGSVTVVTDNNAKLELTSSGIRILQGDNTEIAKFTTNEVTINNWRYDETRNGNCLTIHRKSATEEVN